jgi:hypothetical protein
MGALRCRSRKIDFAPIVSVRCLKNRLSEAPKTTRPANFGGKVHLLRRHDDNFVTAPKLRLVANCEQGTTLEFQSLH